jgi:hypothetical protein
MNNSEAIVETHGPLIANAALWFVMLSPLIGLIVGLLGAWLVS